MVFRRVVYTLCTQLCITITAGDPMDKSVEEFSLAQTYLYYKMNEQIVKDKSYGAMDHKIMIQYTTKYNI